MELDINPGPFSIPHRGRQWHGQQPLSPPSNVASSPPVAPSAISQRRRSAAALYPPAAAPPTQPLPSVPPLPPAQFADELPNLFSNDDQHPSSRHRSVINGTHNGLQAAAAPTLSAPPHHPLSRVALADTAGPPNPHIPDYSDPPPQSMLHQGQLRENGTHLTLPAQNGSNSRPPSSRRALTKALELAREAVQLDSTNDDPYAAVVAYGRSVALLSEVMERVRRGEDSTETGRRRGGRRRSVMAQEEEVRRLKSIHDTYADRMNILSLIYSIPPIPHSPSSVRTSTISVSTESTQPPSPSTFSETHMTYPFSLEHSQDDPQHDLLQDYLPTDEHGDAHAMGSTMFGLEPHYSSADENSFHPYAAFANPESPEPANEPIVPPVPPLSRSSTITPRAAAATSSRPRAMSNLPPPPPPPSSSPPPPPDVQPASPPAASNQPTKFLEVGRPRGSSVTHRKTNSGSKLTSVTEEPAKDGSAHASSEDQMNGQDVLAALPRRPETPRTAIRDTHPLPPVPSLPPSNGAGGPFVTADNAQYVSRTRGSSMAISNQQLVNNSISQGSIMQRRHKTSAPPSTTNTSASSPTETVPPQFGLPNVRSNGASSPHGSTPHSGRSRALSQPGHRPAAANGSVSTFDSQRPAPHTSVSSGRKSSIASSKLNPLTGQPHLVIQTDLSSPLPPTALVPPPAFFVNNLPTTPTSPLPPQPPSDIQRKPYHMMDLLSGTMTNKSGGYITRRLHVPQEVWSQGGAKLANIPEKVRVVEVLCSALEEMQQYSAEYFGAGNVCSGLALGIGSVGPKEAELWVAKLDELGQVCDSVVASFGKKLGVGEGFVVKKSGGVTSWGGKLTRQFDKLTNGKNLDSPVAYVAGLTRLFRNVQLLDEHTKAMLSTPIAPIYAAFPSESRNAAEVKLKRISEFFASVVLTFVIRDLAQLLDKYAKQCEKWLAE